jgi:hypothetical protein
MFSDAVQGPHCRFTVIRLPQTLVTVPRGPSVEMSIEGRVTFGIAEAMKNVRRAAAWLDHKTFVSIYL